MAILQLMNVLIAMEHATTAFMNQQIARTASITHFFLILTVFIIAQQDTMVIYLLETVKLAFCIA
jgi:hypothetical protein